MIIQEFDQNGIHFKVEKIADPPDYRYPTPLVNTHRLTWTLGKETHSLTCIDYNRYVNEIISNLQRRKIILW